MSWYSETTTHKPTTPFTGYLAFYCLPWTSLLKHPHFSIGSDFSLHPSSSEQASNNSPHRPFLSTKFGILLLGYIWARKLWTGQYHLAELVNFSLENPRYILSSLQSYSILPISCFFFICDLKFVDSECTYLHDGMVMNHRRHTALEHLCVTRFRRACPAQIRLWAFGNTPDACN